MNKVFVLAPKEDWIVDRFVKEWNVDNQDISVDDPLQANVIWLLADWCWNHLPQGILQVRKVITTIHHIVPEKFNGSQLHEFKQRDRLTTVYHVPNQYTRDFVATLTQKPIHIIPYWANQKIWRPSAPKVELRKKYGIPPDAFVIGSFQRDTEGASLAPGMQPQPKLEKGPDLLGDFIDSIKDPLLHVVLGGWRRQYIIDRLKASNVTYTYIELPSQHVINDLYQTLDLYPVSARHEGGPQSLLECGLLGIPVISRPVGMANQVLPPESINPDLTLTIPAIPNVEHLKLPQGYDAYRKLIESL